MMVYTPTTILLVVGLAVVLCTVARGDDACPIAETAPGLVTKAAQLAYKKDGSGSIAAMMTEGCKWKVRCPLGERVLFEVSTSFTNHRLGVDAPHLVWTLQRADDPTSKPIKIDGTYIKMNIYPSNAYDISFLNERELRDTDRVNAYVSCMPSFVKDDVRQTEIISTIGRDPHKYSVNSSCYKNITTGASYDCGVNVMLGRDGTKETSYDFADVSVFAVELRDVSGTSGNADADAPHVLPDDSVVTVLDRDGSTYASYKTFGNHSIEFTTKGAIVAVPRISQQIEVTVYYCIEGFGTCKSGSTATPFLLGVLVLLMLSLA